MHSSTKFIGRKQTQTPDESGTSHSPVKGAISSAPALQEAGNQAVQALFQADLSQPKLAIGAPDDPEERQADLFADRTIRREPVCEFDGISCPKRRAEQALDIQRSKFYSSTSPLHIQRQADQVADKVMRMPDTNGSQVLDEKDEEDKQKLLQTNPNAPFVQREVLEEDEEGITQVNSGASSIERKNLEEDEEDIVDQTNAPLIQRQWDETEVEKEEFDQGTLVLPKLTVGAPNDKYERQADQVADKVMRTPADNSTQQLDKEEEEKEAVNHEIQPKSFTPPYLQRLCPGCEQKKNQSATLSNNQTNIVQSKSTSGKTQTTSGLLGSVVNNPSGGSSLPAYVRSRVEPVLGADLGHVKVHNDSKANKAAESIQAKAFTHKNNIYLGEDQTVNDVKLMAHEAAHVVQQVRGGGFSAKPDAPESVFVQRTGDSGTIQREPASGSSSSASRSRGGPKPLSLEAYSRLAAAMADDPLAYYPGLVVALSSDDYPKLRNGAKAAALKYVIDQAPLPVDTSALEAQRKSLLANSIDSADVPLKKLLHAEGKMGTLSQFYTEMMMFLTSSDPQSFQAYIVGLMRAEAARRFMEEYFPDLDNKMVHVQVRIRQGRVAFVLTLDEREIGHRKGWVDLQHLDRFVGEGLLREIGVKVGDDARDLGDLAVMLRQGESLEPVLADLVVGLTIRRSPFKWDPLHDLAVEKYKAQDVRKISKLLDQLIKDLSAYKGPSDSATRRRRRVLLILLKFRSRELIPLQKSFEHAFRADVRRQEILDEYDARENTFSFKNIFSGFQYRSNRRKNLELYRKGLISKGVYNAMNSHIETRSTIVAVVVAAVTLATAGLGGGAAGGGLAAWGSTLFTAAVGGAAATASGMLTHNVYSEVASWGEDDPVVKAMLLGGQYSVRDIAVGTAAGAVTSALFAGFVKGVGSIWKRFFPSPRGGGIIPAPHGDGAPGMRAQGTRTIIDDKFVYKFNLYKKTIVATSRTDPSLQVSVDIGRRTMTAMQRLGGGLGKRLLGTRPFPGGDDFMPVPFLSGSSPLVPFSRPGQAALPGSYLLSPGTPGVFPGTGRGMFGAQGSLLMLPPARAQYQITALTRTRNVYPDFESIPTNLQGVAQKQVQMLEQQLGIQIPSDRVLSAPWLGRVYSGTSGKAMSGATSQGYLRSEARFWSAFQRNFPDDFRLVGPGHTVTGELTQLYGWDSRFVGEKLIHHHIANGPFVVPVPKSLHTGQSAAIHARVTVVGSP